METNPWLTGTALAITVAISYAACALLFVVFPEGSVAFLNSLFHGLDFRKLQPSGGFSLTGFGAVTVAVALFGFFIGALYGGIRNLLSR